MKAKDKDILRFSFTKYVTISIERSRKEFLKRETKWAVNEILVKSDEEVHIEPDSIFAWQEEVDWSDCLKEIMGCLNDLEFQIVNKKVYDQLTFVEIGEELELEWKKVAAIYSYARKKMQRRLQKNGF